MKTFDGILHLQKKLDEKIRTIGIRSGDAQKVVEYMYTKPIVNAATIGTITKKTPASVYKLISTLEKMKIITEITGSKRSRLYLFEEYLNLFKTQDL